MKTNTNTLDHTYLLPIELLEFGVRASNCLRCAGITTLGELAKLSKRDMLQLRNMGRLTCDEIINMLAEFGMWLGMTDEELRVSSRVYRTLFNRKSPEAPTPPDEPTYCKAMMAAYNVSQQAQQSCPRETYDFVRGVDAVVLALEKLNRPHQHHANHAPKTDSQPE